MSREGGPTFRPKVRERSAETERNPETLPLKDLNIDRAEVDGFNLALAQVLQGNITPEQLEVWARRELSSGSNPNNTPLLRINGAPFRIANAPTNEDFLRNFRLRPDQVPTLTAVLSDRARVASELEESRVSVDGFNLALAQVLQGNITPEQLEVWARRELSSGSNPNNTPLLRINGAPFRIANAPTNEDFLRNFRLTQEGQTLTSSLLSILQDESIPLEIRKNLSNVVRSENGSQARLAAVLADAGNPETTRVVNDLVTNIQRYLETTTLRRDVYQGIAQGNPSATLLERIGSFEVSKKDNVAFVSELREAVASRDRAVQMREVARLLAIKDPGNTEEALAAIRPLLSSERLTEREAGIQLTRLAYDLEITTFKSRVVSMIDRTVDPEMVRIYIDGLALRPPVDGVPVDYVQTIVQTRERAFATIEPILASRRIEEATKIREMFARGQPNAILKLIDSLPNGNTVESSIKYQLLDFYKSYVASERPGIFDELFAEEIKRREEIRVKEEFTSPDRGLNKDAFNLLRVRYLEALYPLVEALRADPGTKSGMATFLDRDSRTSLNKPGPRSKFEQRLSRFEQQRELSDVERTYLRSVELLSVFNPYLVACAETDPGITGVFLKHHFSTVSTRTTSQIRDLDYFPVLQIGTGPNGLAALGETARINPDLANSMLIVDAGSQPGGPFAIPEGAAWELNSASKRGAANPTLPNPPGPDELKTVRAFGSPLRWFPGERQGGEEVRQGSINATVDYLVTPDDISDARYPTNEELQLVLALQTALLAKNLALQTTVVNIEPDTNPESDAPKDAAGNTLRKIVTLQIQDANGVREVRVKTDAIFAAAGLGGSTYGFTLEGSRAEKVINESKGTGFPKISTTLDAFNALANRSGERFSPGETVVIWGRGNSADTLIEYIGSLFQGDNPAVRDITKVYVVADGNLSARPRYALINDLKPRNGRGNLIEQVNARITDVDFASTEGVVNDRKLVFFDSNNQQIRDGSGAVITADSAIAATGFRSKLDSLLEGYALQKQNINTTTSVKEPVSLPTNDRIAVAERLTTDPLVLVLGTSSDPAFNADKLAQLPPDARAALLRNGVENAVAIGFRAPDTQAAVNIWIGSQDIHVPSATREVDRSPLLVRGEDDLVSGETVWFDRVITLDTIRLPNNIQDEVRILSPLLAYNVGNRIQLQNPDGTRFTGKIDFTVTYNTDNQMLGLSFDDAALGGGISRSLVNIIKEACMDEYFQQYALASLTKKRRNPKLDCSLVFSNGFVEPRQTFVQD